MRRCYGCSREFEDLMFKCLDVNYCVHCEDKDDAIEPSTSDDEEFEQ